MDGLEIHERVPSPVAFSEGTTSPVFHSKFGGSVPPLAKSGVLLPVSGTAAPNYLCTGIHPPNYGDVPIAQEEIPFLRCSGVHGPSAT